jgi:tetratricopeptide (TPR) repeat protein
MSDSDKTVFISYRRKVASYVARSIFMDLRAHDFDVFMDVETIDSGQFDKIILNQIAARAHFLIILTPHTLDRCNEAGDWLRPEIEMAIDLGRNIVPILADDFTFKRQQKFLTGKLEALPKYNALTIPHDYFEPAMEKLRTRFLKQPVVGTITPAPAVDLPIVENKIAEVISQPALAEEQLSSEDYFNRARKRDEKDYDGKIADYTDAIRLNPQYARAYNSRGVAREANGDYEGAKADYNGAIRLNPHYHGALNNRSKLFFGVGDTNRALQDINEAINIYPKNPYYFYNRGNIRLAQHDLIGAIADFTEAIRLKPDFSDAYHYRANAYLANDDYEEAHSDLRMAKKLKQ